VDIDFAFICDYAEIGNKINALGIGFDTIHVQQIPHFYLVAQIRVNNSTPFVGNAGAALINAAPFSVNRP
jgi:hypothetical protein